ncbi:DUF4031 domain-containing protein [Pseudomonas aeruginosa]
MTVYVDDMEHPFGDMLMCHMIADTDEELHKMATTIGLSHAHWQRPPKHFSHYDICLSMKAKAIKAGAIPVTMRQLGQMVSNFRKTGILGQPEGIQHDQISLF